jgi:molybdopterin converting factor small subunit
MTLRVQLYARARDLAGASVLIVEVPVGGTVADLRRRLAAQVPALAGLLERSALAVDGDFAADARVLHELAEVALLPPVSGG